MSSARGNQLLKSLLLLTSLVHLGLIIIAAKNLRI